MTGLSSEIAQRWRLRLEEARRDARWVRGCKERDTARESAQREIRELLESFNDARVDLRTLRSIFDTRTRTDWDLFGLAGTSGAMFLNTLVKHVPSQAEVAETLREAITFPSGGESDARRRMTGLHGYLSRLIEAGSITRRQVQPSRAPFFVSAAWHMTDPDRWPIFFDSAKTVLERDGLFEPDSDPVDGYFRFRNVFLELNSVLGTRRWELEHLCSRLAAPRNDAPADSSPEPSTAPPPGSRVWLVAPGPNADHWDEFHRAGIIGIGWDHIGDLREYADLDAIKKALRAARTDGTEPVQDALACWEFAREMGPGDTIFAKKGRSLIVGYGVVTSDYRHDSTRAEYRNVRDVLWLSKGSWRPRERPLVMKAVTEIGGYPQLVADIRSALQLADEPEGSSAAGPPGCGKTFVAARLAWLLVGSRDPERMCTVQFHQSYAYEDFVRGYRPLAQGGFAVGDGPFLRFCDRALQDRDAPYVMVVDEINRGNLSKILGELLMLIEGDKRDPRWAVTLSYSAEGEEPFYVPPNLYLIGTMNTADRSLALVDYALRRRFAFMDMDPDFDDPTFVRHLERIGVPSSLAGTIRGRIRDLNERITAAPGLGRGFCIGQSYFCQASPGLPCNEDWYERIVKYEIAPLLREYWFDRHDEAERAIDQLLGAGQ